MRPVYFFELTPSNWETAKFYGRILNSGGFVFRGQEDYGWQLTTTFERVAKKFGYPLSETWHQEKDILQRFKSRAHHYLKSPPVDDAQIEWLSIVRHYGGPTRLLDFTNSFYIASFFAMEPSTKDASVWAINNELLARMAIKKGHIKPEYGNYYPNGNLLALPLAESFVKDSKQNIDLVLCVAPPRLNERLAAQQGVFLFPCNSGETFEGNLCKMFDLPFSTLKSENATAVDKISSDIEQQFQTLVVKIKLPRSWHSEALYDLFSMNIDYASLFPDLEGFAKSLYFTGRVRERRQQGNNLAED